MRRFYKQVSVSEVDDGFAVLLDQRELKTPAKRPLHLPSAALASLVADEWQAQGEEIRPHSMPHMRLTSTAVDRVTESVDATVAEFGRYVGSDLLCYRAEGPQPLIDLQASRWDPLLAWAQHRYDVSFEVTAGIMHVAQSRETQDRLMQAATGCLFRLTGLAHATATSGSAVIALAMSAGHIDAQTAFAAACLDDLYQQEVWGEDAEQKDRLANISLELAAMTVYFQALSSDKSS